MLLSQVPGVLNLRGSHTDRLKNMYKKYDQRSSQYAPGQRRNQTFISRLQAVQAAVDQQLLDMTSQNPHRRCCLITFNSELTVYGDGSSHPITISGGKLNDKDVLVRSARDIALPASIQTQRDVLSKTLFE